jgi:hypothetical protein
MYYFPLVSSLSTGIKQLYVDSSSGLLYNPSSDFLLCNSFQANSQVSSNYYNGLSTVSQISLGSYTNPIQAYGLGTWNSTLSSIVPTFTLNTVSDSILYFYPSSGTAYIGTNNIDKTLNIEVDSSILTGIQIGHTANTNLYLGNTAGTTTIAGYTLNIQPTSGLYLGNASSTTYLYGVNSIYKQLDILNTGSFTYNNSRFHNIVKTSYTNFAHNAVIPITVWQVMYSGSNILQVGITPRNSNNSQIKINVNIPLSYHGISASNNHCSIARSTTIFTGGGQTVTTDIVPPNTGILTGSQYGVKLFFYTATSLYESKNFTYIDNSSFTAGTTYYYAVVVRQQSVASVTSNIGNSGYVEITAEEIF